MTDMDKWQRICSAVRAGVRETTVPPGFSGAPKWQRDGLCLSDFSHDHRGNKRLLPRTW